jgi:putative toxin-antitoxin system antitoxin component (TIGR02293 family)
MEDIMVGELNAVVQGLGGRAGVGRIVRTDNDLRAAIREGLPHAAVEELMQVANLSLRELAASLDLSVRSLQRRKRNGRLARYESDRIYRLARIVALAEHFLGGRKRATDWLKRPNRALGGVPPLEAIDTELGAREVENVLGRIGYGGIS